ncbi:hypothetical protein NC315_34175 [Streptomyces sp. G2]|uniref:helix-turn-helix domain-containing protein n=1 Tax=Streptomyces sp. G2 TaxID=1684471 RepID=UPI00202EE9CF|nr:hypothetical protein [Streptomyces sp. G2]MCM1950380.1 hypothetical protein [Streptomyces sp. G2]
MFQENLHRHDDVNLVMSALRSDPKALPVLIVLGTSLRHDVATALREVIATGAWMDDSAVRLSAAHWGETPRFHVFLDRDLEKRRDRGPKRDHLDAALSTAPETRTALYRVWAAQCPQHCRTRPAHYSKERHLQDYRQALFGWYAAIQHAHKTVITAARRFSSPDHQDPHSTGTFTDWLTSAASPPAPHGRRTASGPLPDRMDPLQELLLMLDAWSPHTFEALDVAFTKADGEEAIHSWGAGFEPAGRQEAQAAAEALTTVLTPDERYRIRGLIAGIEANQQEDRDYDLAKEATLACTSIQHHTFKDASHQEERETCARARARVYGEASQPWTEGTDRAASAHRLARLLLGPYADRIDHTLATARIDISKNVIEQLPKIWRDNAKPLAEVRAATGMDLHDTARFLGIQPATLARFEQGAGNPPGRPAALRYLQLLVLACTHSGQPTPDCIPDVVATPVTALPTTP